MGTVRVDGAGLAYDEAGTGPTVVLVHGTGADASWFARAQADLAPDHRVVAYDRRGYGRSAHAPVRDHRVHERDLLAVLAHLGGPVHVVGWSSGGNVALGAAIAAPAVMASLTVVEAPFHGLRNVEGPMLAALGRAKWAQLRGRREEGAAAFFRWVTATADGGNAFDRAAHEDRQRLLAHADNILAELDPHLFGVLAEHLATRDVAALPMPLAWLLGGAGTGWFARVRAPVAAARPDLRTVTVDGGSHLLHVERPEVFAAEVRRSVAAAG